MLGGKDKDGEREEEEEGDFGHSGTQYKEAHHHRLDYFWIWQLLIGFQLQSSSMEGMTPVGGAEEKVSTATNAVVELININIKPVTQVRQACTRVGSVP